MLSLIYGPAASLKVTSGVIDTFQYKVPGGSTPDWTARCVDFDFNAAGGPKCLGRAFQRVEGVYHRSAFEWSDLTVHKKIFGIARIVVDSAGQPDYLYGLATRVRPPGSKDYITLDTVFLVVLTEQTGLGVPDPSWGTRASNYSIYGVQLVKKDDGTTSRVPYLVHNLTRHDFTRCKKSHPVNGVAFFASCPVVDELAAISTEYEVPFNDVVDNYREERNAIVSGDAPVPPRLKAAARAPLAPPVIARIAAVARTVLMEPMWVECPLGCCTAGDGF